MGRDTRWRDGSRDRCVSDIDGSREIIDGNWMASFFLRVLKEEGSLLLRVISMYLDEYL